ncbi:MAG TPA: radical SAM protein, partial [Thermomicrobiales bacterium]|nr:radical SAM protein [Thermomicrobiales bacterium]
GLPSLLESIAEQVPNLPWLRMLYIYPSPLTLRMVDVMARHETLLPYLDMPLQHADREVLRRMNRPSDPEMTMRLIDHARASLPGLVMRTTFIVGYPGETDDQFRRLLTFVEEQEFDHVGVFTYSPEAGTKATALDGAVPAEVAEERRNAIMEAQHRISLRKNRQLVGTSMKVLVEAVGEAQDEHGRVEPISVGRAERHAPEVDGLVFVPGAQPVGEFVTVRIAEASPYDLWAADPSGVHQADERSRQRPVRVERRRTARQDRHRRGRPVPLAIPVGT